MKVCQKEKIEFKGNKKTLRPCASAGDFSFFALLAKAIYREINNK